jgi:hypothetical protein
MQACKDEAAQLQYNASFGIATARSPDERIGHEVLYGSKMKDIQSQYWCFQCLMWGGIIGVGSSMIFLLTLANIKPPQQNPTS